MIYKKTADTNPRSSMIATKIHQLNDENPTISARQLIDKVESYLSNLDLNGWFNISTFSTMNEEGYSVVIYYEDADEVISFTIMN